MKQSKTLIRQILADLRDAFPDVQFDVSVPSWSKLGDRIIEIRWCSGSLDYDVVQAVTAKHDCHGAFLFLNNHVPCERWGEPTNPMEDHAICVHCEPDLWGCSGEHAEAEACIRLGLTPRHKSRGGAP